MPPALRLRRSLVCGALAAFTFGYTGLAQAPSSPSREWPTYGHDPGGMRFSPLTEVTPANVGDLKVTWVYHMKPAAPSAPSGPAPEAAAGRGRGRGGAGFSQSSVTPLVAGG